MVLTVDAAGTVQITLFTDNDNEGGWADTDGPDTYNVSIQGTNSESWQVSKNATETGILTLSDDISGTGNHFYVWMKSDLSYYYTSIKIRLISTAGNYREYTLALAATPYVSGDFKCFALDIIGGAETGTFVPSSVTIVEITVDNSASGNIRSVINNWIDAMYFGRGLTFEGNSTGVLMFAEAAAIDELAANKYGVMFIVEEQIFVQGDVVFQDSGSTEAQSSNGENVVFTEKPNATNTYRLILLGADNTIEFINTSISATGAARFDFIASGTISSFTMSGGTLKKASTVAFKSGQTITNVNFTECGEVDNNGATLEGCNFISTIETVTGALIVNVDTEANACENLSFTGYSVNSRYAIYVDASVTEFDMTDWYFDDPNNTIDYALYWAGGAGTLTINALGSTNLVDAGCTSAGGTVEVIGLKSLNLTGLIAGTEVRCYTGIDPDTSVEIGGIESSGTSYNLSHQSGGVAGYIIFHKENYESITLYLDYPSTDGEIPIQQRFDRNYENP